MHPIRQLIRWSIPGAMLVMVVVLWELIIALVFAPASAARLLLDEMDPAVTLFVVALGVPLGFVMNQLYFTVYDGLTPYMRFLPVPLDRGAQVLRHLKGEQLRFLEQSTAIDFDLSDDKAEFVMGRFGIGKWRLLNNTVAGRKQYAQVRRQNWRAVLWLMLHGVPKEHGDALRGEYGGRTDTYHAIGGCRYAVVTGTLVTGAYNLTVHGAAVGSTRGLVCIVLIAGGGGLLFLVLAKARRNTLGVMQGVLMDSLRTGTPVEVT